MDNYLVSLLKHEPPRRTYLKLTSGDALDLVQTRMKEKSLTSEVYVRCQMHESVESTEEKKPGGSSGEKKIIWEDEKLQENFSTKKITSILVLPPPTVCVSEYKNNDQTIQESQENHENLFKKDIDENIAKSDRKIPNSNFPEPILKKEKPKVPAIVLPRPSESKRTKGPMVNFRENQLKIQTSIDKTLLIPPSAENLNPSQQLFNIENNASDVELLLKQFNRIDYEKLSESEDSETAHSSELNDSLEIPIEGTEPKFEPKNFKEIKTFLEGEIEKSEKLIEKNLENFSTKFNLLLDEAKRIEKYME